MIIQFALSAVFLGALVWTWRRFRQQALRRLEAFVWSALWLAAGVAVWWPNVTTRLANLVGIGRGSDFVLYIAVTVLTVLVLHLHVAHDKLSREFTELVRHDALKDVDRS